MVQTPEKMDFFLHSNGGAVRGASNFRMGCKNKTVRVPFCSQSDLGDPETWFKLLKRWISFCTLTVGPSGVQAISAWAARTKRSASPFVHNPISVTRRHGSNS